MAVVEWMGTTSPASLERCRRAKRAALSLTAVRWVSDTFGMRRRAFERAYREALWTTTGESLSGNGSGLDATERLRVVLPSALRELEIRTLVDIPCGDWNWMAHVDLPVDRYVGGDLLPSLVQENQRRFGNARREFRVIDLCRDALPAGDLLLCRDALVHFSYRDIWRALANVATADIRYFAATSFPGTTANQDQLTGVEWRHVNLEVAPFELAPPTRVLAEGFNRPDQILGVWHVEDVATAVARNRERNARSWLVRQASTPLVAWCLSNCL